jgi:FixJ family two-component response regulator
MSVPLNIAIIDDDEDMRLALEGLFESHDFSPSCYEGAASFLDALAGNAPDVVVTDLQMKDIDGIMLTRALKAHGCPAPVILITAFATPMVRASAEQLGVYCVLEKPFEPNELLKCVSRAAGSAQSE